MTSIELRRILNLHKDAGHTTKILIPVEEVEKLIEFVEKQENKHVRRKRLSTVLQSAENVGTSVPDMEQLSFEF